MRKNRQFTASNILIFLSLIATISEFIYPEIFLYGMNNYFLVVSLEYYKVGIQFILYQFLHGGLLHLLSNGIFIFIFGNMLEEIIGKKRYILFFLLNTIFVGIALLFLSKGNTIGISGFSMAILAYYYMHLKKQNHPEYGGALTLLLLNIIAGFYSNISLVGHLFGAIFGLIYFGLQNLTKNK